jgi:hypothetical protein
MLVKVIVKYKITKVFEITVTFILMLSNILLLRLGSINYPSSLVKLNIFLIT